MWTLRLEIIPTATVSRLTAAKARITGQVVGREADLEKIAVQGPDAPQRQNHSRGCCKGSQKQIFERHDCYHLAATGPQGLEQDAFLNALVAAAGNHADEHDQANGDAEKGHKAHHQRNFVEDGIDRAEDAAEIDD